MKIHNLRLGFACNSSSSHSLIFLPGTSDSLYEDYGDQYFGWDCFTLASKETKLGYLGQQILTSLREQLGEAPAQALAMSLINNSNVNIDGTVDHQSVWQFPRTYEGNHLDTDFIVAFRKYLERDGVVVLGGNDNDGHHELAGDEEDYDKQDNFTIFHPYSTSCISRYDEGLKTWTIFDRSNGSKIRLDFDEPSGNPKIPHVDVSKASLPELVDVKITDKCYFECDHCYQGSTKDAPHADGDFVRQLIKDLREAQVFEVAYGGGEPTTYPNFLNLLSETRDNNIVPNFTTRNFSFIKKNIKKLTKIVGRIAFSVDFEEEINKLEKYLIETKGHERSVFREKNSNYDSFVSLQHVVGSVPQEQLDKLLKIAAEHWISITLLGWKNTGRGSDVSPHKVDWREACKKAELNRINIDTALARSSDLTDIDKRTYHTTEGSVSCYVDAVQKRIGPSSYSNSLLMKPYNKMIDDWKKIRIEHGK